jgi:hypothetical protein
METFNESFRLVLVSRAVAFGMAALTTLSITVGVAATFSEQPNLGTALRQVVALPLRALFG